VENLGPSGWVALSDPGVTSGVAEDDDFGVGGFDVGEFALEKGFGHSWLEDIVGSGASAAAIGLGHFDEFDAGEGADEVAGAAGDALTVGEVASVVIGEVRNSEMSMASRPESLSQLPQPAELVTILFWPAFRFASRAIC